MKAMINMSLIVGCGAPMVCGCFMSLCPFWFDTHLTAEESLLLFSPSYV